MDLASLTEQVCRIAMDAGNFLKEERKTFRSESVEKKHAHDYVSYVDKESEKQIVAELSALLPEAGFINRLSAGICIFPQYRLYTKKNPACRILRLRRVASAT